jgi:hypothetical protein
MSNYELYFYKGTSFSPVYIPLDKCMEAGKEQIVLGLRLSGMSLEEQAKLYLEQLDTIEACLFECCPEYMNRKTARRVSVKLNMSIEKIYTMWSVNICSLLIMKKLKNDDMNGIQKFHIGESSKFNKTFSKFDGEKYTQWKG